MHFFWPLSQFRVILKPFANVKVDVSINKRALNTDLACDEALKCFLDVFLCSTCSQDVQFLKLPVDNLFNIFQKLLPFLALVQSIENNKCLIERLNYLP